MKRAENNYFSWVVAYIDSTQIDKVEKELRKQPEYKEVEAYIPTVKILTKTFKGKHTFEEVPLLFNYGFFKIPRKFAIHAKFLDDLKSNVSCIYAWVKDPLKIMNTKPKIRLDEKSVYKENEIMVATASAKEIAKLVRDAFTHSIHDSNDIANFGPGTMITLRGYPFEGVMAEIVQVDPKKKSVKVKISIFDQVRTVGVSFDNVYFSIYHRQNFDDSIPIKNTLNAMAEYGTLDKQTHKNYDGNK